MDSELKEVFNQALQNLQDMSEVLKPSVEYIKTETDKRELESIREDAIVEDEVNTMLSDKEKTRLRNIGFYFTDGAFKVIDNFIKKRDKEMSMNTALSDSSKEVILEAGNRDVNTSIKSTKKKSLFQKLKQGIGIIAFAAIVFRDKIVSFFENLWDNVKGIFEGTTQGISNFFDNVLSGFFEYFEKIFDDGSIKESMSQAFKNLSASAKLIYDMLNNFFTNVLSTITLKGALNTIVDKITSLLSPFTLIGELFEYIKSGLSSVFDFFNNESEEYRKNKVLKAKDTNYLQNLNTIKIGENDQRAILNGKGLNEQTQENTINRAKFGENYNKLSNVLESIEKDQLKNVDINRVVGHIRELINDGLFDDTKIENFRRKFTNPNSKSDFDLKLFDAFVDLARSGVKLNPKFQEEFENQFMNKLDSITDGVKNGNISNEERLELINKNFRDYFANAVSNNNLNLRNDINNQLKNDSFFMGLSEDVKKVVGELAGRGMNWNGIQQLLISNNAQLAKLKDDQNKKNTYELLLESFKVKLEDWSTKFKESLPLVFGDSFINALKEGLGNVKLESNRISNQSKNIENTVIVHKFNMDKIDNSIAELAKSQQSQLSTMNEQNSILRELKDAFGGMKSVIINNVNNSGSQANIPAVSLRSNSAMA